MPGHHVIQCQIGAATAVLAVVAVTREDLAARQAGLREWSSYEVLKADHGWRVETGVANAPERLVANLQDLRLAAKDQHHSPPDRADVQRFIVLIEDQRPSLDRHRSPRSPNEPVRSRVGATTADVRRECSGFSRARGVTNVSEGGLFVGLAAVDPPGHARRHRLLPFA